MTLVFVHGFLGGAQQWAGQKEAFHDRNVVTLDLPGFGANAHLEPLHTIGAYADWVLARLTDKRVERFDLVGHSMGGMVVQEMIARAPERISRLVLYGTGATGALPGRFETIAVSKARAQADGPQATARRIAATWFLHKAQAEAYEGCATIAAQSGLAAILSGLDAMGDWRGEDLLDRITAKTLILWGDQDRTYPWSQTETLWRKIKPSRLAVLPDCAHAIHLERPQLFNAVLRDFVCG